MNRVGRKILSLLLMTTLTIGLTACGSDGKQKSTAGGSEGQPGEIAGNTEEAGENLTAMGRYVESSTAFPEGSQNRARAMKLLDDGSLAYFDGEVGLYKSEDGGESWGKLRSCADLKITDIYLTGSDIAVDGSVATVGMVVLDDDSTDVTVKVTDAGGTVSEVDGNLPDEDYIMKVFWRQPGELYGFSVRGKICKFDLGAGEIKSLFTASERPEMLAFSGKQLLALENEGVEMFHLEQNAVSEADSVLDSFCKENFGGMLGTTSDAVGAFLLPGEEGVVWIACQTGLYRHVLGGTAMEQLVDGKFSTLGNNRVGLCSLEAMENGEFLLLTSGEELIRLTYDPNMPTVPQKQLTLYSLHDSDRIQQAIHIFQKENPDVFVNFEIGMPEGSTVTLTDAMKNLNVELMSDNGPDILLMDGLEDSVYEEKGMLADLSGFMEELKKGTALLSNITEGTKTDKGLYVVPAGFKLPMIFGKDSEISSVTDLASLAELTERLRAENPEGSITGCYDPTRELYQLMALESGNWLQDKQVDKEALTAFLTQAKRIHEVNYGGISAEMKEYFAGGRNDGAIGNQTMFMLMDMGRMAYGDVKSAMGDMPEIGEFLKNREGYAMKLWEGTKGAGFMGTNRLAISARAKDMELAQAFLKVMLGEELQDMDFFDGLPVNQASFEKLCQPDGKKDQMSWGGSWRMPDGTEKEYGYGWPETDTFSKLYSLARSVTRNIRTNGYLEEAVIQYGTEVLKKTMDIEEAVAAIEKAVAIYLAE